VQDSQRPTHFVTGVVVANAQENGAQLLDLRLRSLRSDPIPEGDKVQVKVLAARL
jgi:hypothetical protein